MENSRLAQANVASAIPEESVSARLPLSQQEVLSRRIRERVLATWANLYVDVEPFVARILDRLDSVDKPSVLDSLPIEELFLCYACSTGSALALDAFSREYEVELRAAANKLHLTARSYDDLRQVVWNRLFVANEMRPPGILDYRGTGPLHHWFRVLATRAILDESRKETRTAANKESAKHLLLAEFAPDADPELDRIRELHKRDFRAAFEEAVGLLSAEERNLLRCAYLSGMSTDSIGRAFGMHKATAARHLARARNRLLELTRTALKRQLGADSGELDSVLRLFDGELSISISRLLR